MLEQSDGEYHLMSVAAPGNAELVDMGDYLPWTKATIAPRGAGSRCPQPGGQLASRCGFVTIVDVREVDDLFCSLVRRELAERGMSQADLARCTGVRASTISKIINGKQRPSGRQLAAIALELEIDLRESVGDRWRAQLVTERRRVEELEARCSELEQLAKQSQHDRAIEADARRQAERKVSAEHEARRNAEELAATRCATLEARAKQAEEKCARLEQAERERVAKEKARRKTEADPLWWQTPSEPSFAERVSFVVEDDRFGRARARADLGAKVGGKLVEAGLSTVLFRHFLRKEDTGDK